MYVYIYIYVYVYICMYMFMYNVYVHMYMYLYKCTCVEMYMYILPQNSDHRGYFGRHLCVGDTRENIACCLCFVAPHTPVHILYNINTILNHTSQKHMMIHMNIYYVTCF